MNTSEWLTAAAVYSKWTKAQLADHLIEHGTVYPNRAGLLKWAKDELVNSAIDQTFGASA